MMPRLRMTHSRGCPDFGLRISACGQWKRRRAGTTLIEVVVMIGVSMIMFSLVVMTIHLLLRAERHSTLAVWNNRTMSRVSRDLRDDVQAAVEAELQPDGANDDARLTLKLADDHRVTYQIADHVLTRIETTGGEVKRREIYHFPPKSTLEFQREEGPPVFVALVILRPPLTAGGAGKTPDATAEPNARRIFRIEATLGRRHRFAAAE